MDIESFGAPIGKSQIYATPSYQEFHRKSDKTEEQ